MDSRNKQRVLPEHICKWLEDCYDSNAAMVLQAALIALGTVDKNVLIVEKVEKLLIESNLFVVTQFEIADQLHMSKRTLVRKLQGYNTCFRELLDKERKRRYFGLLANKHLTPKQIAYELGYRDSKSFYRALQRWICNPSANRSSCK